MLRRIFITLALLATLVVGVFWWLSAPAYLAPGAVANSGRAPGTVIAVERVGGHNRLVLATMLWMAGLPVKVPVSDGVEMFRLRYWSEMDGKPVEASGLMSIPYATLGGGAPRGTVMFLHGTSPDRANSPSVPALANGVLPSAIFAGGGYMLLAPDYIGLGTSHAAQTYVHAKTAASAARDLLTAAQRTTRAMHLSYSPDLYLVGFSQGGHATAVVQRSLEQTPMAGVKLKAAAAISGPFDLTGISIPYAFEHKHSLYLAYLAHSYALQYHQPLGSLIAPRYAAVLPKVFDGNHDADQIAAALPADPRALFLPDRLHELETHVPNWFTVALDDNEAWRWLPKAPLRLYFGDEDKDVSPQDSISFYAAAKKRGGNVHLISVGPYDHENSVLYAVPDARSWFDSLSNTPGGSK